jgi:hypothetical protein
MEAEGTWVGVNGINNQESEKNEKDYCIYMRVKLTVHRKCRGEGINVEVKGKTSSMISSFILLYP